MPNILLVKTSSLGDVVHNLPVVSDLRKALGDAAIDWVVEKAFAAIPAMHPGVRRVIACELRSWRRSWLTRDTRREWRDFVSKLRAEQYDFVLDTQGLLKSAIIARAARGYRVGLDWRSSREPLAPFYDRVYSISWALHAVERNRRLAALALGYGVSGEPRYDIHASAMSAHWLPTTGYMVCLHGTSQPRKLWPEQAWVKLGLRMHEQRIACVFPWGSDVEHARAERLAAAIPSAVVAPRLTVAQAASVIAGARAVVGVDTGLTHLAAALAVPTIGIYGATDPAATGVRACGRVANLGTSGKFPSSAEVIDALRDFGALA
jgi:heptosyltransferase-1